MPDPVYQDEELVARIGNQIGLAVGFSESKLSKERESVMKYYNGERPYPLNAGDTKYVSFDVWDAVESMKAQLLETFSGNNKPVSFSPVNGEDAQAAQVRTDYCTHVIFRQNPGFQLMQDVIDDGLLGRVGVAKVWWETKHTKNYYDLTETTYAEVAQFIAKNPGAEITQIDGNQAGEQYKRVRFSVPKDRSQVRIKVLPPEQFGIAPMSEDMKGAEFCFHREPKTVSDLIKMGFDPAIITKLQDNDRIWLNQEPEVIERFWQTDDMIGVRGLDERQKSSRQLMLYECYMEINIDGDDDTPVSQLHKIVMAGDQILSKEPVDRKPFVCFTPLPRPHAFWGTNYAKMLIPTQNARTYLTRSIVNHALITNNPRLQVMRGTTDNPRELMENRIGGLVNVKRMDGIAPIPQAGLNPFVFQTISLLDEDKEEITGISRLSQGLSKDAISKQNSQGMVNDLISVSQIRQKIIARNFAENFLRSLYESVYQLVLENEDRAKIIQVAGSWTPLDLTQWPEDTEMEVAFALGYGEQDKELLKWQALDKYLSEDAQLKAAYPPEKRYNVVKKAMEAMGIKDVQDYILPPNQVTPPPPSPMEQADLQVKLADAAVKQANAVAAQQNVQLALYEAQAKVQDNLAKLHLQTQRSMADIQLHQDQLAHKVAVDAAEIQLAQIAAMQDKVSAMAQPTR
jgi:hypothetical protein